MNPLKILIKFFSDPLPPALAFHQALHGRRIRRLLPRLPGFFRNRTQTANTPYRLLIHNDLLSPRRVTDDLFIGNFEEGPAGFHQRRQVTP
jgi:hypothetical protein